MAVPMASVGTHGECEADSLAAEERFSSRGVAPGSPFSWLKRDASLAQQTARQTPRLCQSAAGRRENEDKTGRRRAEPGGVALPLGAACRGAQLGPRSVLPCPRADQGQGWEEDGSAFGSLGQAQCQLGSTCFPGSTNATNVPLWPAGPGPQTHTTALFTSTPLLLCEEVMGYSATLVPFSSFLRGFLGGEAGTAINDQRRCAGIMSFQGAHQAPFWVSILVLLALMGARQKLEMVPMRVTKSCVVHTRAQLRVKQELLIMKQGQQA